MAISITTEAIHRHADRLIEELVDGGPATASDLCQRLEWSKGRFSGALRYAREHICPGLGISIPNATPTTGWQYEATTEWQPVEDGAAYALGLIESRLRGISRDVAAVKPHLEKGTREWRRASFLDKHLNHIVSTLGEINGSR